MEAPKYVVGTANGTSMRSVATDRFPLQRVPQQDRRCKKFIEVTLPLVSVGRLCIHGLIVAFDAQHVYIYNKRGRLVNKGYRDLVRNLYMIPIEDVSKHEQEVIPYASAQLADEVTYNTYAIRAVPALISYHHASLGDIPKLTFLRNAIIVFYAGFPGLTPERIRKYLTKLQTQTLEVTTLWHQKLIQQNLRSSRRLRSKKHNVTIAIIREDEIGDELTNMIAMDLPGRYPITSANGHKYIFIMFDLDSDYIKGVAM